MSRDLHPDLIDDFKTALRELADLTQKAEAKHADILGDARAWAATIASYHGRMAGLRALLREHDPDNAEKYADPPEQQDLDQRAAVIAGLRELADAVEMQPDAPVLALRDLTVYGRQHDGAADEAEISRYATALGVTAVREHPAMHFEATRKFGPGCAVRLRLISTHGSTIRWKLGDPMPSGVPVDVVARYGKKWHEANPGDGTCPYWVACDVCTEPVPPLDAEPDQAEADGEPPGGEAAVALLDAEQEAFARDSAAADEPEPVEQCRARKRGFGDDEHMCVRDAGHWDANLPGHDPARADHFNGVCGEWPAFEAVDQ